MAKPDTLSFSFIIPVYNRPDEIDELLQSIAQLDYPKSFEVVLVEDGSPHTCEKVLQKYPTLNIHYHLKQNTGAGLSRNFGMEQAKGNYFLILDSDVLVPPNYLTIVEQHLIHHYTDFFGGPDAAHTSFTSIQKAINYAMTSFFTTGGLRGGKTNTDFQPRSFNMGMSKIAFEHSGGFSSRKIGEDIALSFRLKALGFQSQLIADAFVYHKRRSTFLQFFKQTFAFGKERPKLTKEFPDTTKLTYWFPSLFVLGTMVSLYLLVFGCYLTFGVLGLYVSVIWCDSSLKNKSIKVGFLSIIAVFIQFFGYGTGFLKGIINS